MNNPKNHYEEILQKQIFSNFKEGTEELEKAIKYNIGEKSLKTGLIKKDEGVWVKPEEEQKPSSEEQLKYYIDSMQEMVNKMNLNPLGSYKSVCDFIEKEGKFYKSQKLTKEEMEIVKRALNYFSKDPQPKQCFYNSQLLSFYDPTKKIKYVEGYIHKILPGIEHAWNSINGKIIDITLKENGHPIIGIIPEDMAYYGVEVKNFEEEFNKMMKTGFSDSILNNHNNRWAYIKNYNKIRKSLDVLFE